MKHWLTLISTFFLGLVTPLGVATVLLSISLTVSLVLLRKTLKELKQSRLHYCSNALGCLNRKE